MKNLANLNGAKALSKKEQRNINGGVPACNNSNPCPGDKCCYNNSCYDRSHPLCWKR